MPASQARCSYFALGRRCDEASLVSTQHAAQLQKQQQELTALRTEYSCIAKASSGTALAQMAALEQRVTQLSDAIADMGRRMEATARENMLCNGKLQERLQNVMHQSVQLSVTLRMRTLDAITVKDLRTGYNIDLLPGTEMYVHQTESALCPDASGSDPLSQAWLAYRAVQNASDQSICLQLLAIPQTLMTQNLMTLVDFAEAAVA